MSYLNTGRDARAEFQHVILRKDPKVREWVSRNMDGTEQYCILRDPNGLALRVGIVSIRAKELLLRLHAEVFTTSFTKPNPYLDENGVWWAWFGYSEPWIRPTTYVPMQ